MAAGTPTPLGKFLKLFQNNFLIFNFATPSAHIAHDILYYSYTGIPCRYQKQTQPQELLPSRQ